jgi:ATPases involved in chromosome partitioning
MEVIAVANQKGGCSKTTTAVNLSTYLAVRGKKVLLIDLDPQGSTTTHFGIDKWHLEKTMYDVLMGDLAMRDLIVPTMIPGLDIAPTNNQLSKAERDMTNITDRETILKRKLGVSSYDYVLIDTPPSLGYLTLNALVACDTILVPVQVEFFALEGLAMLTDMMNMITDELGHKMNKKYLLSMYDARTNPSKDIAERIRRRFGDEVFRTVIPRNVRLADAPSYGQPVCLTDPESTGAKAYAELADEVIG